MGRRTLELGIILAAVAVAVVVFKKTGPPPEPAPSPAAVTTPVARSTPEAQASPQVHPLPITLTPLAGKDAPVLTRAVTVAVKTDAGDFRLMLYPEAAPNSVERFLELVEVGFYDNTPVSRVVDDFVAQFGINSKMSTWKKNTFKDDESFFQLLPGTICFAKAGPNTNSTQVFINLVENNRLADPSMNFSAFGQVVEGMETVEKFRRVGEPSMGLDQNKLWADTKGHLATLPEQPTMILSMKVE